MNVNVQNLLNDCGNELNKIDQIINSLGPLDQTRAFLTKYALIKTSGTLEYAYRSIIADHFSQYNIPQIDTYLNISIRESPSSVKYDNICTILGKFDVNWKNNFKTTITSRRDGNQLIQASNSLVNNRHAFAHGKEPTATLNDIKQYYNDIIIMINELDQIVT